MSPMRTNPPLLDCVYNTDTQNYAPLSFKLLRMLWKARALSFPPHVRRGQY